MSELRRADAALTEQDKTDIRRDLGLGTAAVANVPASGNAASGEVVKGNDTRLSDTRTPTTHSHTAAQVTDFAAAADARIAAASVNALADIDVTSPSVGQVLKWNGAAWVNDTDDTAAVGGATNLSYTPSPTGGTVHSDTGADATVPLSDGTNAGLLAPAQHAKLAGVAANATANSSDATLLARANHTGTQAASTISDFSAAADARISAAVGVTVASAAQGTDARDWNAATVDQAEAEAGTATTRRAWTAQRVAQAIATQVAAWWAALTVGPSKITMSTARLLGRTTAGSGGAEEISVGSGLLLTAGTLSATASGGLPTGVTSPGDGALDFATGAITASRPSINVAQTWNNAGVPFEADVVNVTNTASAAASNVIHRKVGGSTVFRVQRDGAIYSGSSLSIRPNGSGYTFYDPFGNSIAAATTYQLSVAYDLKIGSATGGSVLTATLGPNSLSQESGSNTQGYYLVHVGGTNYERLALRSVTGASAQIATQAGGTGTRRNLELSAPQVSIDGLLLPNQRTNATEPSWVNGAAYFNTDLDKLRIGGASAWETVTSA